MRRLRSITICWSTRFEGCPAGPTFRKLVFCAFFLGVVFWNSLGKTEIIDRIVAIVNEDIITLSELEEFRKSLYPRQPKANDWLREELELSDVRRHVLNALIEERLIDQEATRQNIVVTQKTLEDALESLRQERGLSQPQLEIALKAQGLTYEEYRGRVERGLKRTRLVNRTVKSEIEIREEDLRVYYQTHIKDYMAEETIRISHILLPLSSNPTKDEEAETSSIAKEMLNRAEKGEDLAEVARQYSHRIPGVQGGDIGYFKSGEMIPAIEKRALSLKVGEMAGPILTAKGVFLIRVTDKKGGKPIPFAEIKKTVEKDYYRNEVDRQYRRWVKKLKERSFIEVKL